MPGIYLRAALGGVPGAMWLVETFPKRLWVFKITFHSGGSMLRVEQSGIPLSISLAKAISWGHDDDVPET
jgi:hypothetical protein